MNQHAIDWIWQQQCPANAKLVLITLASYSDRKGNIWVSQKHLADKVGMSRQTLVRWLKVLREQGLISCCQRTNGSGGSLSNLYNVPWVEGSP